MHLPYLEGFRFIQNQLFKWLRTERAPNAFRLKVFHKLQCGEVEHIPNVAMVCLFVCMQSMQALIS